jgi:fatty acid desaturase
MESRHRWTILAAIAFTAACVGAIAMLTYAWPHALALVWFYAGFIASLVFLVRAFLEWKSEMESRDTEASRRRDSR